MEEYNYKSPKQKIEEIVESIPDQRPTCRENSNEQYKKNLFR